MFFRIDTLFVPPFAVIISGFPSASMSPVITFFGVVPTVKATGAAKDPELTVPGIEVFLYTDTLAPPLLAQTMSVLPSPSRSLSATPNGWVPVI